MASPPCGPVRGGEDCQDFIGFREQVFEQRLINDSRFHQQFDPEDSFIGFFDHNTHLGNELGSLSRPVNRTIIRRN